MLRKKITAWVLTAAMLTGLGAAAPVTAFAQTAEDVQQNRCYINGDEVRAYDVEDTIYVVVDDLSAYGFNVQKSKKSVTITSGTNGYYFDESFSPNTESSTMGTGSVRQVPSKARWQIRQLPCIPLTTNSASRQKIWVDLVIQNMTATKIL